MPRLYLPAIAVLFYFLPAAQQPKTAVQPRGGAPAAAKPKPTFTSASDSLKFAIRDFRSSMNNLFGSKKDTVALIISNVEYDDPGLELLKEDIKKLKGAKFLGMQFKSSIARLDISYKGKPTELWDILPEETRKSFKIVEANETNLLLASRAKSGQ